MIASCCLCAARAQEKLSAGATVEGTVVEKGSSGVTVLLERVPTNPLSTFDGYSATIDSDGRFHFEGIAPGDYRLTASSSSQMSGEFGSPKPGVPGTILALKASEDRKDLTLDLFPDPVGICGRVLDADGNPVRTDVEVYTAEFRGPTAAKLQPTGHPIVLTDPNGYFMLAGPEQLGVGPLPQYLAPSFNQQYSRFFLRANGVWYPSTESFADAVAIPARPISQSGCDAVIRMPRTRCAVHRVLGKVEDMSADLQSSYEISLYEVNPAKVLFKKDTQASIYSTDHVEFDNVCDGSYGILTQFDRMVFSSDHRPPTYASGLFHVEGEDADVIVTDKDQQAAWRLTNQQDLWDTSAQLPPPQPASIQGSLALADGLTWPQACPTGNLQRLTLERGLSFGQDPKRGNQQPISTTFDKEGHFSFDKLEPGSYSLNLNFAHGAAYLKSIELNGQPLPTLNFTLAEGEAARLDVEVSNDPAGAAGKPRAGITAPHFLPQGTHPAASISGRLTGPDAAGAKLKLTEVGTGRPMNFGSSALETTAGSDGSFHLDGVTPGIYKLSTEGEHHQYSEYGAKGPGTAGLAVDLTAGQQRQGLDVKTYARTPLCGRVIDSSGRPIKGVDVNLFGYGIDANGKQNTWTSHTVTGADGRYQIADLGPKTFSLWAQQRGTKTYFPSNPDINGTPWVNLGPQTTGCPYNIYLRAADGTSALAHTVSGAIEGKFDPSLGDRFYVDLEPAQREFIPNVERVQLKEPGSFTLKNVWPGKYTLTLYGEYGNGSLPCPMPSCVSLPGYYHHPLATQQITVTNRNVEGLHLAVGALPTLDGEIVVDGSLPQGWTTLKLTLFWGNESKPAKVDADGHFSFPPLDAFRYGFSITDYPPESAYQWVNYGPTYLASATLDGQPLTGQHFELHNGQKAHLVIHVKVGAASGGLHLAASGPPTDPYRDPCAMPGFGAGSAAALMIPDPLPDDDSGIIGVAADPANNEGYVQSAPPGHYRVVAANNIGIPSGRFGGAAMLHDFLVKLSALGKPVDVVAEHNFDFTAPILTDQVQQLMAEMGMTTTH